MLWFILITNKVWFGEVRIEKGLELSGRITGLVRSANKRRYMERVRVFKIFRIFKVWQVVSLSNKRLSRELGNVTF